MNNVLPRFIDSYPATQEIIDSIPAKRQGTTDEIADVVPFSCSEKASYINGQSLLVDGGFTK
jgi:NAD(P)-dependent dehydrogenase (short-subunit alcohol dehydrogenase family)